MKKKICCFFGHSDTDDSVYPLLYDEAEKHITQYNVTTFYVGNYGNFDRMSVTVLKELKRKYSHIEIVLVLAYLPTEKMERFETNSYDSTLYPEGLETVPQRFAINCRNRWVAEQSDCLIAYVRESYGGAYESLRYALRKGKQIVNLADKD